jgi:hypothetical protein
MVHSRGPSAQYRFGIDNRTVSGRLHDEAAVVSATDADCEADAPC